MSFMAALLILSLAPDPAAPAEPSYISGPIRMKASEIRKYNEGLSSNDPNYIRCTTEVVTGTLAKRKKTCRTNQDWARITSFGNDEARAFVEPKTQGWTNGTPPGP
jgi:hypothetical protein